MSGITIQHVVKLVVEEPKQDTDIVIIHHFQTEGCLVLAIAPLQDPVMFGTVQQVELLYLTLNQTYLMYNSF